MQSSHYLVIEKKIRAMFMFTVYCKLYKSFCFYRMSLTESYHYYNLTVSVLPIIFFDDISGTCILLDNIKQEHDLSFVYICIANNFEFCLSLITI